MAYACPTCGAALPESPFGHCPACGQRLCAVQAPPPVAAAPASPPPFAALARQHPAGQAHWMARASASLGYLSLLLWPLCLVAVPMGITELSAIAQGKHPHSGTWPSTAGVVLGTVSFTVMVLYIKLFARLL